MARVISDSCVSCGACESECPVGAISMGSDHMEVNADTCIDCGACENACPMSAISEAQFVHTLYTDDQLLYFTGAGFFAQFVERFSLHFSPPMLKYI